jgi:hypothetical protein
VIDAESAQSQTTLEGARSSRSVFLRDSEVFHRFVPQMFPAFDRYLCNSLKRLEPTSGFEPLTCRLRIGCSTN